MIGYARVSTDDQNPGLQEDALKAAGCERIYTDRGYSGARMHRPAYDRMLETLREGDTLVCWKLDRIGRSTSGLVELVNDLRDRGVAFRSLTEGIETDTPGGKLVFHIFAALAEFERDLIRERTREGLRAARARGRQGGRPAKLDDAMRRDIKRYYFDRGLTAGETSRMTGVSVTTVRRAVRQIRDEAARSDSVLERETLKLIRDGKETQ